MMLRDVTSIFVSLTDGVDVECMRGAMYMQEQRDE